MILAMTTPRIDPTKAKSIGEFCRLVRERLTLSQGDMADRLGINRSFIAQMETNRYKRPVAYLKKIKRYLITPEEQQHMVMLLAQTLLDDLNEE